MLVRFRVEIHFGVSGSHADEAVVSCREGGRFLGRGTMDRSSRGQPCCGLVWVREWLLLDPMGARDVSWRVILLLEAVRGLCCFVVFEGLSSEGSDSGSESGGSGGRESEAPPGMADR